MTLMTLITPSHSNDPHGRYGLGQTYEILTMYYYALYYYRKATALRPYDARMWCAMAGCYKHLRRTSEAIKCYQRAETSGDREGTEIVGFACRIDVVRQTSKSFLVWLSTPFAASINITALSTAVRVR